MGLSLAGNTTAEARPLHHEPSFTPSRPTKQKGQLRNTASKSTGAAQLKRNAKKRNNINKSKGK